MSGGYEPQLYWCCCSPWLGCRGCSSVIFLISLLKRDTICTVCSSSLYVTWCSEVVSVGSSGCYLHVPGKKPCHYGITECLRSGLVEVTSAQAGSPQTDCLGPCPDILWISPSRETLQPLSALCCLLWKTLEYSLPSIMAAWCTLCCNPCSHSSSTCCDLVARRMVLFLLILTNCSMMLLLLSFPCASIFLKQQCFSWSLFLNEKIYLC